MSTAAATAQAPNTHDPLRDFLAEGAVRHGNPFARRVAALRQAFVDAISDADLAAVARVLLEKALAGNIAAAKLLVTYLLGKPAPAVDPDRLDAQEWQNFKETAPMAKELAQVGLAPDPELPLRHVRIARPALAYAWGRRMQQMWHQGKAEKKTPECQPVPKSDTPPPPIGDNGGLGEPWPPLDPEVWAALAALDLPPPDAAE